MVLLRESGMTKPEIAAAMGVSLSTVNRAPMAYDQALKPKPNGGRPPRRPGWCRCLARRRRRGLLGTPAQKPCA